MKKQFAFIGAVLLTTAMFSACGDDNNTSINNAPVTDPTIGVNPGDPTIPGDVNVPGDPTIPGDVNVPGDPTVPGDVNVPGDPTVPGDVNVPGDPTAPASSAEVLVPTSSVAAAPIPSSSVAAAPEPKSSAAEIVPESSSAAVLEPGEKTYKFGYALKNKARPSAGCGKNSALVKTKSVENGDRFEMMVEGQNREYFITLPKNYDNTKPYKLLFAMHCMGSNAEDFVHHYADQDHPSPYYGQQKLDTEGNYIFVSPRGDTDGMPWSRYSDKDHKFFDKLLTTMEDNYCIDTTRVFVTGFSFGSMYSYSLAEEFQERVRAVVTYAVADYNIYEPHESGTEKKLPIAWMNVHGKNDGTCPYNTALTSALPRVLKKNGKASDGDSQFTDASSEKPQEVGGSGHLCYDFKNVDERFPVKWCSWNGGHQWTAFDNGNWQSTWVPEEVHKFFEQF